MLKENIAIIGCGGCGTNIAFLFEQAGYNCIHINSSKQDEDAIKGAKVIYHLKGFNGCAGKRELAEQAIAENIEVVDKIKALKEDILYLVFSAAGGTGAGISPVLAEILAEETEKTIGCIVVLPDRTEDYTYYTNAYNTCKELVQAEGLGSIVFVDNNTLDDKKAINKIVFDTMDSFFNNNSSNEYGNVDEEEKRTMLGCSGAFVLNTFGTETNSENVLKRLTVNNIYAPLEKDGVCEYIAIINSAKNPKQGIKKADVINLVGTPQRTYEGYGAEKTIIAIAGLSYPFTHLKTLADEAKEAFDKREKSRKIVDSNLEDIELVTTVKQSVSKKQPEKKLSRRELLLKNMGK